MIERFRKELDAPSLIARIRIQASPSAVMKMIGISHPSSFSLASNCKPDIFGFSY
jgi:hypothetical protein